MVDWRADRIGAAHRGENPMVMARMPSGFAVIGDTQQLPGYSLLICENPAVNHLTDLDPSSRVAFLSDLALLGEAVQVACARADTRFRRINYEILGNSMAWLHGHLHARYEWEPPQLVGLPVWCYPAEERNAPDQAYSDQAHGTLR